MAANTKALEMPHFPQFDTDIYHAIKHLDL